MDNWQLQQYRQRSQPWSNNLPFVERRGSRVDNWQLQQCRQRSQPWRNNLPFVERRGSRVDNWQLQQYRQRSQPWSKNLPFVERRGSRVDNWQLQQCRQRSQPWRNNPPLVVRNLCVQLMQGGTLWKLCVAHCALARENGMMAATGMLCAMACRPCGATAPWLAEHGRWVHLPAPLSRSCAALRSVRMPVAIRSRQMRVLLECALRCRILRVLACYGS